MSEKERPHIVLCGRSFCISYIGQTLVNGGFGGKGGGWWLQVPWPPSPDAKRKAASPTGMPCRIVAAESGSTFHGCNGVVHQEI